VETPGEKRGIDDDFDRDLEATLLTRPVIAQAKGMTTGPSSGGSHNGH
jgi:hypothetical protein